MAKCPRCGDDDSDGPTCTCRLGATTMKSVRASVVEGWAWYEKTGALIPETICEFKRDALSPHLYHEEDGDFLMKIKIIPIKPKKGRVGK